MTDITEQDRRVAHEWAASIGPEMDCLSASTRAVARVILATVDAPTPTVADEIMDLGRALDQYGHFDALGIDVAAIADRVAQMEHDLTEARAEAERLIAERQEETMRHVNEQYADLPVRDRDWFDRNGNPDPADVKPGEAWIVECRGERRTAVKDRDDDVPWNTVAADGLFFPEENENVTLLHRLVPAPRVITNADDLDQVKRRTVIRDAAGVVCECDAMGDAWTTFNSLANQRPHIVLPATVLWEPEA